VTTRTITPHYESCCHVGKIGLCEKKLSFLLARLRHSRELKFASRGAVASAPGFMRARRPAARRTSPARGFFAAVCVVSGAWRSRRDEPGSARARISAVGNGGVRQWPSAQIV